MPSKFGPLQTIYESEAIQLELAGSSRDLPPLPPPGCHRGSPQLIGKSIEKFQQKFSRSLSSYHTRRMP